MSDCPPGAALLLARRHHAWPHHAWVLCQLVCVLACEIVLAEMRKQAACEHVWPLMIALQQSTTMAAFAAAQLVAVTDVAAQRAAEVIQLAVAP